MAQIIKEIGRSVHYERKCLNYEEVYSEDWFLMRAEGESYPSKKIKMCIL